MLDIHPEGDPGDDNEEDGGDVGLNLSCEYARESEPIMASGWSHFIKLDAIAWHSPLYNKHNILIYNI